MAMDEKGLGKRLQAARQDAGLTQQQLCAKANLSFSTLTKIERGAIKAPSIFTVGSIAQVLGLSLDELVGNKVGPVRQLQKTKSGASFIYFDVNGCLVYFYQRAFNKVAAATGVRPDEVESAFWHFNDDVCRGTMSMRDFNKKFGERLGVGEIDWQAYYLETVEPIAEMQEILKWAAERYKIGLVTNIMPGLLSAMMRDGHLPALHYDAIIDSSEVAAIKPEPEIFQTAQAEAGCPPEEILYIDDSRANIMAAEKFGWKVLWFDDSRPKEAADRVRAALEPAEG
jgi:putative hydrolase of the HAD superfamily